MLDKDTPYELESGDIFTLLVQEYPVKVIIEEKSSGMLLFHYFNSKNQSKEKLWMKIRF